MFDIHNYGNFVAAILIFQIIPGPGTIAILNATARNGIRAGFGAVAGTLLGDLLFMVAAIAGLSALMLANPLLFRILQWVGAVYLCWMGVQLLRAKHQDDKLKAEPQKMAGEYFRQSFLVSLTNPKVILFFVAFFPLFMRSDSSSATLAFMALHVTALSLIYQSLLVIIGNSVARRLKTLPSARRLAARLAGISLITFGIKLASDNR